MYKFLENWVYKYPVVVIITIFLLAAPCIYLLPKLQKNSSPDLLPLDHPSKIKMEDLKKVFTGTYPRVGILIESDSSIFNTHTLERIKNLTQEVERINLLTYKDIKDLRRLTKNLSSQVKLNCDVLITEFEKDSSITTINNLESILINSSGYNEALKEKINYLKAAVLPIIKVSSLANIDNIINANDELRIGKVYNDIPRTKQEIDKLKKEASDNQLFENLFVTKDEKRSGIFLEISLKQENSEAVFRLYNKIKDIIKKYPGKERTYIAGYPVAVAQIATVMDSDTQKLFPIVIVIILLSLWLIFRAIKGIIIPIFVVVFSIIFILAIQYLFNIPINIISTTIPVFMLSVGVADGLHIITEFQEHRVNGNSIDESIRVTMRNLLLPVSLVYITTALGFFSLAITSIDQVRIFGLLVGFGSLISMVLALIAIPALLIIFSRLNSKKLVFLNDQTEADNIANKGIDMFLEKLTNYTFKHPVISITPFILAIIFCSYYIYDGFYVDNNGVKYFKKDSELVVSTNALNNKLSGSDVLNIVIKTTKPDENLKSVKNLKIIDTIQSFVNSQAIVGKTLALTDLVKRMNYVMNDNKPEYFKIPEEITIKKKDNKTDTINGNNLIAQYLFLYENNGGKDISDFTDFDYRQANLQIILTSNSSNDVKLLMAKINKFVNGLSLKDITFYITGLSENNVAMNEEIVFGQLNGIGFSLLSILILLSLIFRNVIKSILGLIPIVLSMVLNFGVMGFLKIPLDIGSAIITGIAFGIGIDYVIHYFSALNKELENGLDYKTAMKNAIKHTGKPILYNAFIVGAGFLTLLFSGFVPLNTVGWMIAFTMLIACVSILIIIPALVLILKPKFLLINEHSAK
ncbi:MAG: MMPL family transporter [Bacteroidales bacterium]|nr:MMPL family transporter [Bacteroidales bacterium]